MNLEFYEVRPLGHPLLQQGAVRGLHDLVASGHGLGTWLSEVSGGAIALPKKMLLVADSIRSRKKTLELLVEFGRRREPEVMYVISPRDRLNLVEAVTAGDLREHQVTNHVRRAWRQLGEGNARLKRDTGLFRQHGNGADGLKGGEESLVEAANAFWTTFEVMFKVKRCARVNLIAVGELPMALRTAPKRSQRAVRHHSPFGLGFGLEWLCP